MEAPEEIIELVDKFERNLKAYKNPNYEEEQVKQEFINPLFKALGWDIDNISGAAPQYRDVIFEDSIKVGGGTKAPDYCFRLAGRRMFFVEAKKPSVNLKDGVKPAYQLRRYAWSAKLPLSILTDFEELVIYESRTLPKKNDRTSTGRILYLTFRDYVDRWDEIYNIFSKEAVFKGAFDQYAESAKQKHGTQEVDDVFLGEIEGWRELFAKNIALRNKELTVEELNYAVQQIIDRIIFLRMAEDRGIEKYGNLYELLKESDIARSFTELCKNADEKYNSGLFHFKKVKGRTTSPDELTSTLKIDDGIFKTIIKGLYYPDSPYEFSVLAPEILGNVYEQFLGKVIRLTNSHMAKVEEKPEVKKAGGVYYTPQFIVDYIVKNTVEKYCKGSTPNKVSKLRILDPACGSGSFLLGAYSYLLKWHVDYYLNLTDKKRLKENIYESKNGEWHLTIQEKKRILKENIYGVDIDPQAVEVTKLSLLLKVLEGENRDALEAQQKLIKEKALPDLDDNIKCGNTLISPEIYDDIELILDTEELNRINPFDWESEFADVISDGGFDVIIGNPPYIRIQAMKEWAPTEVDLYKKIYKSASKGNYDIYVVFVEKGLNLLNQNGMLGFILPHKFFNAKYGEPLRSIIAEGQNLNKIVYFGAQQVFEGATTYTNLLFLNKLSNQKFRYINVEDLNGWRITGEACKGDINLSEVTEKEWNFIIGLGSDIFNKLNNMPVKFGEISKIFVGLQTSADPVFLFKDSNISDNEFTTVFSKELNMNVVLESELLKPVVRSGSIGRYWAKATALVLFPYENGNGNFRLINENVMASNFPKTWEYLLKNKKLLSARERGKFKDIGWYQLYPKNLDTWEQTKIMLPYMINRLSAYYDKNKYYFVNVTTGGFGVILNERSESMKYVTGLFNSKLLDWYMKIISTTFRGGYFAANKQFLTQLPIRTINFDNPEDVILHERMIKLVEQMIQLQTHLKNKKSPNEKERLHRQIDSTDKQINNLVYELYGLTQKEIKIVEECY